MKTMRVLCVLMGALALAAGAASQDKPKAAARPETVVPLKVQFVFTETEGEKKTASLPYVLYVNADDRPPSSLRMGIRVPIVYEGKEQKLQYADVGTNIDCGAYTLDEGRFRLSVTVERSSVFPTSEKKTAITGAGVESWGTQPIFQNFRATFNLVLRDAQTVQSVLATDPLTGRLLKVDTTLTVVK